VRREVILAWLAFVVGLAVVAVSALDQIDMPFEGQDTRSGPVGQLVGQERVGQTFVARYDHLYRVDLFLGTYARSNTKDVIFHLRAAPDAPADIFSTTFNAATVKDYAYRSFTFPPIPDSAGRSYYFFLESPSSEDGNAITAWKQTEDLYPRGQMVQNGAPVEGDLQFQAHYRPTVRGRLTALLDRLAENKPSVWGDRRFYVVLALMTVLGAGCLLSQTVRLLVEEKGN
jgi:hypothetical protein